MLNHDDDEALSEVDFDEYREGMARTQARQGLLSPTITKDSLEEAAMWSNGLQGLDGTREGSHILPEKTTTESPSPTLDLMTKSQEK